MTLFGIAARNALRNKLRAGMTVLGGAVAVVTFVLLRTVLHAWNVGVEQSAKDRLATRNKVSLFLPLPMRYVDAIEAVPGVKAVSYMTWFGAKWPKDPGRSFASFAVGADGLTVYPEMSVAPDAMARWKSDREGAIVGDSLATQFGWKLGDRVVLDGTIYPGPWAFNVDAIYRVPHEAAVSRASFLFHWEYLNETLTGPRKDHVGWIVSRIADPSHSADVCLTIDKLFDDRDEETATMSERAANNEFLAGIRGVFDALDVVSAIILVIMMLVLGNTMAMNVRERTTEYGVLRALGFQPGHIRRYILGEALVVSLVAAGVGLALAVPIVRVLGAWLEENMGQFFPFFRLSPLIALVAVLLTLGLGVLAALVPAWLAGRMRVTDALRRIA